MILFQVYLEGIATFEVIIFATHHDTPVRCIVCHERYSDSRSL